MTARRLTITFAILVVVLECSSTATNYAAIKRNVAVGSISFQEQAKADESLDSLRTAVKRNKNDIAAWNHLGLALEQIGDSKEAAKAYENAAKLGDKILLEQLGKVENSAEFSQTLVSLRTTLTDAGTSAENYIRLAKLSGKKLQDWRLRADGLNAFAEIANSPSGKPPILSAREVSVKARIISKPEPQYTEDARQAQIRGTVVLRAILAANGSVIAVRVVKGLGGGLSKESIAAAHKIKFVPALKDGRPVSMFVQLEYYFHLY
jgi:TonB family protein